MFAASKTNAVASASDIAYIEDVFSAYLYTGNTSTQTITNDIDLSTKGGLVWIKSRTDDKSNAFFDTNRGVNKYILSNSLQVQTTDATTLTAFNTTGFSLDADTTSNYVNTSGSKYVSWTFRKQPKFFDVVTYTGTGANRTISHSLGSVPACIMVKRLTASTGAWQVYHRSLANTQYMVLNTTALVATGATRWNSTTPTSSVFSLGTDATVNASGGTYVAYIFAHDAGGFGLTGSDNVISCGAFTTDAGNLFPQVNLGWEPQFILYKSTSASVTSWRIYDNMRGLSLDNAALANNAQLLANGSDAETLDSAIQPNATGFISTPTNSLVASANYIYIAIRRGPMKIPTVGTSVFHPNDGTISNGTTITNGFPIDLQIGTFTDQNENRYWRDRLRGYPTSSSSGSGSPVLLSNSDVAESTSATVFSYNWTNTGATAGTYPSSGGPFPQVQWLFRRAPSFFDQVCYTGTGSSTTISHNLKVVPELIIVKARNASATNWPVYSATTGNTQYLILNSSGAAATGTTFWNSTTPTSSVFTVGSDSLVNQNTTKYVAYLFATCAGVSKVGSYSGNGGSQTIDCGFTGGARFVLIKRSNSTGGSWYVWDTARGIVTGNDPYLTLNTDASEVSSNDYIDPASSGFIVNNGGININATGSTYIFLAIA